MTRNLALCAILGTVACLPRPDARTALAYAAGTWRTLDEAFSAWSEAKSDGCIALADSGHVREADGCVMMLRDAVTRWQLIGAATIAALDTARRAGAPDAALSDSVRAAGAYLHAVGALKAVSP